ncbi:MAG: response regulator [Calothrix sp. FI2-JRJ7]|nr:response regulator [Calothrix sp. FI2-JRJ7]
MPLGVLIVEDSDDDELMIVRTLQSNGYDVTYTRVETAVEMDAALDLNIWDLVLCDYCLPDFDGLEALKIMQKKGIDLPFIIVSGAINEEIAVSAMKAGASDFVTKSRLMRLVPAIRRELKEAENRRARFKSELALKKTQEQLRFVLETNRIGTWEWNITTNEITCSSSCEYLFDITPGTGGKLDIFVDRIHPQDRDAMLEALTTAQQSHQTYQHEYRVIWQDGSIHWIQGIGDFYQPAYAKDNLSFKNYNRMLGIVTDVTKQKLAEQKIYEQAALLDVTTNAILLRHLNGIVTYWNKGAERLYGWTAEEVIGKNVYDILYGDDLPPATALESVIKYGEWQGELNKITKDEQDIIVDSHWTLIRGEENQPKYILTVDTDITAKKQLESRFMRTQRLENIGILAGGIAHDLNNILTPILAVAQLLPLTLPNLNRRNQDMLHILEASAKRGADLVKQILCFARGNNDEKRLILQIKHLLLDIEQIIQGTFPKSIEMKKNIHDDLWTVSADSTQLHQVFMNLAINARDAMPEGGTLTITAENQVIDTNYTKMNIDAHEGNYILITFQDTGIGIRKDIIDKIFDPFFTTKEVGKGTGLGLSTVFNIIKNHDGFLEVDSTSKGSTFKIFLPASTQTDSTVKEDTNILNGNGELILFVDDEIAISEVSKTTLETHKYQVLVANNGIEAIAIFVQNKLTIKAVIIDLMMPSLDGVTTIRALQKIMPNIKIIAMSGSNDSQEKTKAIECGVQEFVPKPFTANLLLNTLHRVLN